MDPAQWERMMQINTRAPLELSVSLTADLPDDRRADIININDSQAMRPRTEYFAYTASKIALHSQTRNLALELAPRVRVNEIALGAVLPPESPPEAYEHATREQLPLGEFPTLDNVADTMLFLLGNPTLTGQTINVDGGQNLFT
jgi:NAD(P)-dependent dehydrogenase (short-subunit alcohol dehydrogenase family)